MNVTEALNGRHSTRAFLSTPIEKEKLNAILEAAARTPSWANSQPWEVFIATGETLEKIKKGYLDKYAQKAQASPEVPRPAEWSEAAKKHQQQLRPDMLRDCGDAAGQFGKLNQAMFNTPAVVYIYMDKVLSEWSLYDIGAYSQSLMLAAVEQGLSTIPAITLVHYPEVQREVLKVPDNLKLTIGIAIGYADKENKINNFISGRGSLDDTVHIYE
ncbi:dihydropteridine reductase [Oxobacter pfennigii]|uniref:Dihydropteridine reductase n=1 Tax=Oxobacter pfennigii TaxID=36849 RepID=A0A0P8YED0_9CLOT|nr:nitroreductase [Oxobacter pfennigii]KPU45565.1 dihydropteridine reductase [Oxobacter pfennigii]